MPHTQVETPKTEIRGLNEKSTGNDELDDAIRSGGAIPAGKFLDYVQFHDPKTGSSLVLKPADVTPEKVAAHLAESRKGFGITE